MAEVASAFVSLIPSAKGFRSGIEKEIGGDVAAVGERQGRKLGGGMVAGLGAGLKGFAGPLAALGAAAGGINFFKGAIEEGREAARVGRLTEAVIKSTGGAANVTAAQVGALAEKLSAKAGVDDELVQSGANLLLTFKNIRNAAGEGNDIFNQATAAALDLSAAGFGSVESASKMMGKALNDPVKGMTALGRAGVTFTAQQKEQIKTLVANGDALGAQKIILAEVMSQVGGAAAAQADPLAKASVAWANFKEQIGTALLPVLGRVATFFTATLLPAIQNFAATVGPVLSGLWENVSAAFSGGDAGGAIAATFTTLKNTFMTILPVVQQFGSQIMAVLGPGISAIVGLVKTQLLPAFNAFVPAVMPIVKFLLGIFGGAIVGALKGVVNVVKGVIKVISGILNVFAGIFTGNWKRAWEGIKQIVGGVFTAIKGAVQVFLNIGILGLFRRGFLLLKGIIQLGWNALKRLFTANIGTILGVLRRMWQAIPNLFRNAGTALRNVGRSIVQGLVNGVRSAASWLKDALLGLLPGPLKKFAGVLGIDSPSKVFQGFGENIGQGLVVGVDHERRQVERAVSRLATTARVAGSPRVATPGARNVTIVNNYPLPERASDGLAMSLRRAQFVGAM